MAVHLPSISIIFRQLAGTFIQRSARGVAVLIVKDDTEGAGGPYYRFGDATQIPEGEFTAQNEQYIRGALSFGPLRAAGVKIGTSGQLAQALAEAKALAVAQQHPDDTVIGCDTVVDCDGAVFGKPSGEEDAVRMLHALSGREHKVHTGLCVVHGGKAYLATETTRVQFAPIEESDLLAYARTPEPYDKAGAYAIQGHAALWCSGIVGCYYNIMGLPVHRLAQVLRQAGAL